MITFKVDILEVLKEKGFSTYYLSKQLGPQTLQNIRNGKTPGLASIDKICSMLKCQPGTILKYIPDEKSATK